MSNTQKTNVMKILCLGNVATGKTCIIRRYVNNEFSHQYRTTIGVDFMLKDVNINGKAIKVQFWDLAGQERFSGLTRAYYRSSVGAVVVFDLTSRETFDTVINWKRDVESKINLPNGQKLPIILLGNKCDLVDGPNSEQQQCASDEYIQNVARENGFYAYYKVSALSGTNLHTAITDLTHEIVRRLAPPKDEVGGGAGATGGAGAGAGAGAASTQPKPQAQQVNLRNDDQNGKKEQSGGCC